MQTANEHQIIVDVDILQETIKNLRYSIEEAQAVALPERAHRNYYNSQCVIIEDMLNDLQRMINDTVRQQKQERVEQEFTRACEILSIAWTKYRLNPVHREYQSDYADAQVYYEARFNDALACGLSEEHIKNIIMRVGTEQKADL